MDLDLDLVADPKAHRTPGLTRHVVPHNFAYRPAMHAAMPCRKAPRHMTLFFMASRGLFTSTPSASSCHPQGICWVLACPHRVCVCARARVCVSILVNTWWTALLNRVSPPEALSTPFCFCFCFCCSLAPIFCSTVCISGLHPTLRQVHPLLMRARARVCMASIILLPTPWIVHRLRVCWCVCWWLGVCDHVHMATLRGTWQHSAMVYAGS